MNYIGSALENMKSGWDSFWDSSSEKTDLKMNSDEERALKKDLEKLREL
jgi:hypothetical protein